jgi:hypothetical protein
MSVNNTIHRIMWRARKYTVPVIVPLNHFDVSADWDALGVTDEASFLAWLQEFNVAAIVTDMLADMGTGGIERIECNLTNVAILYLVGVTEITSLPDGLIYLNISYGTLTTIPILKNSITELLSIDNSNLTSLPVLPTSLVTLYATNSPVLTTIPTLPATLTSIRIYGSGIPTARLDTLVDEFIAGTLPKVEWYSSGDQPSPGKQALLDDTGNVLSASY